MPVELKLRKISDSFGVVLPKEVLAHLKVSEGDVLTLTEAPDGVLLTTYPKDSKSVAVIGSLNRRYQNTLRDLAQ